MSCGCCSTDNKVQELDKIIAKYKDTRGALIPVLHDAQELYGYLPMSVQKGLLKAWVSLLLSIWWSFYTQFYLNPKGKYKISVCLGTACYVKELEKSMTRYQNSK